MQLPNLALKGSLLTNPISPKGVISTKKDKTVMLTLEAKRANKDARSEMFAAGMDKDADGSKLRDAVSKMRAK